MRIIFFSNYINHHQIPLSNALYAHLGNEFTFVATRPIDRERLELGWSNGNNFPYVLAAYDSPENKKKAIQLAKESDIVVAGSSSEKYARIRVLSGKVLFRYSERLLKNNPTFISYVRFLLTQRLKNPPFSRNYMLCASAYTAADYAKIGLFRHKTFKWGYFPEVKKYEKIEALIGLKHPASILWVGRLIGLKHPELAIQAVEQLRNEGYDLQLDFIGTGVLDRALEEMVKSKSLGKNVHFLGSMPPEEVRRHMEKAQIFLFTSDRNEGWGAVLNEAMNSGCAVIASHAIGSVPYLIKNGENGLVFKDGDLNDLKNKVKRLVDRPDECARLGRAAYDTMVTQWNAENAAKRLIKLCENILAGGNGRDVFTDGVCSEAKVISDLYNGEKNV